MADTIVLLERNAAINEVRQLQNQIGALTRENVRLTERVARLEAALAVLATSSGAPEAEDVLVEPFSSDRWKVALFLSETLAAITPEVSAGAPPPIAPDRDRDRDRAAERSSRTISLQGTRLVPSPLAPAPRLPRSEIRPASALAHKASFERFEMERGAGHRSITINLQPRIFAEPFVCVSLAVKLEGAEGIGIECRASRDDRWMGHYFHLSPLGEVKTRLSIKGREPAKAEALGDGWIRLEVVLEAAEGMLPQLAVVPVYEWPYHRGRSVDFSDKLSITIGDVFVARI